MSTTLPAPLPSRRQRVQPWLWRLQNLLSNYLPLLLMALLASGTWWLVKNTPLLGDPGEPAPLRHVPDYRMANFEIQRIGADGRLNIQIAGTELRHYPDTDTVEIDQVRVRAVAPDGSLAIAVAKRAISNGDGTDLQLLGDVRLRRLAPGSGENATALMEVRGEFLQALSNSEILRSHLPVTIRQGSTTLNASNFEYRHVTGQLKFTGKVQGQIAPRAAR
ncbi:LPS export ABC transporter periplasmic protein LptC [Roseateles asaccharophilus]|uniref:Lipopolysaccharide export system protein LptC n=1 Tax=Roseateles asaccharophilus TaxID=582607 RepID=A0ABU2A917_9BURK|nr:LPS export ABC transporter periplasmic protein LptC [Roseateles asaccharophilus]MDR7333088.1 lipopolysaccharide export system protein LptC [Roseateles asaccharophilus]